MALYHLDPRQAGTGAAPDVETRIFHGMWHAFARDGRMLARTSGHEHAALRAAREAAGFGHVAEQPCQEASWDEGPIGNCYHCGWQRDAHRVQS